MLKSLRNSRKLITRNGIRRKRRRKNHRRMISRLKAEVRVWRIVIMSID
jgi:hypothetical protein